MRTHPFALLFPEPIAARFDAIRAQLGGMRNLDAFVLGAPAIELMRDLRPDEGLGDGTDDFMALVHAAYLFWADGQITVELDGTATRNLMTDTSTPSADTTPSTRYIQVAPRLVWGRLSEDAPYEPLDGWFATPGDGVLGMVACFGLHPERPGISVVSVHGPPPVQTLRSDGSPAFAPTMQGGDLAGLAAVETTDELLLLGWRAASPEDLH